MKINNRRYIGSKTSLLNEIEKAVKKYYGDKRCVFADLFSGTGVVAYHFAHKGYKVISNDILYSNYVSYKTWLSNSAIDLGIVKNYIEKFNNIDASKLEENYFSKIYSDKYFHENDAKKIGYIREEIEKLKSKLNEREYYSLLTSLIYATDKIANTVGHFEHYLSKKPEFKNIKMRMPTIENFDVNAEIFNMDANTLSKSIKADIVYIDPPYNARQYVNFYHVLENLASWKKPTEFEGASMKFKRDNLKSEYSRVNAPKVFRDLIYDLDCELIIVSYNNTYKANSTASNNKISEEQIYEILSQKGVVNIIEIDYKFFNSGKTNFNNHKEYIYICRVGV